MSLAQSTLARNAHGLQVRVRVRYELITDLDSDVGVEMDLVLDWKKKTLVSEMRVTQREWASFPVHDNGLGSVLD